ncbi:MAG: hypothetical protein AAFW70_00395 [Cyanobacteria bacterium J06635_10]
MLGLVVHGVGQILVIFLATSYLLLTNLHPCESTCRSQYRDRSLLAIVLSFVKVTVIFSKNPEIELKSLNISGYA